MGFKFFFKKVWSLGTQKVWSRNRYYSPEHRERNKAVTSLERAVTESEARDLLGPGLTKVSLKTGREVMAWMPELPKTIHPVKCKFSAGIFGGGKVYAWAGYDSLEVSYVKKGSKLKIKVKTIYIGGGDPKKVSTPLDFEGYLECGSDTEVRRWVTAKSIEDAMAIAGLPYTPAAMP